MKFKEFVEICKASNIRCAKLGRFEISFHDQVPTPMALDPVSLSKVFADQMPPDSAMMFASTEDMPEPSEDENGAAQ